MKKGGLSLIEVVVGTAVIMASLVGVVSAFNLYVVEGLRNTDYIKATYLAEEGLESLRILRDESWSSNIAPLQAGEKYYPQFSGSSWSLASSNPGLVDGRYDRYLVLEEVYRRDSDDDIVASTSPDAKTIDSETIKASVRVSWGPSVESSENAVSFEDGETDGNLASFPSNNSGDGDPAQSFTAPSGDSIEVSRIEIYIKKATSDPSDIFIELREVSTVGSILGTSETIDSTSLSGSLSWQSFDFTNPPSLNPDTVYYLRLRSIPDSTEAFSGSSGFIHWGYKQTGLSPYAGGKAYRYVGRQSNPDDQGQELDQYDFSFRVYKKVAGEGSSAIDLSTYLTDIHDN